MDIVLEVLDTFLFDRIYATLVPVFPANKAYGLSKDAVANATFSSARELPTTYQHQSASQFLHLEPSGWAYMSAWPRDFALRQAISLFFITWIFGMVLYFGFATLSYLFVFDKRTMNHPRYLKNQKRMEIAQTMESLPVMAILTVPFFMLEVRGYSKLYDTTADGPGMWYNFFQFPLFLLFTDCCIYWIHRGLHHPLVYKTLHKPHHKWIVPTPFASHAFHPLDGYAQGLPYHIFPFIFPLQKFAYIALFTFINMWTITIHDGEYVANSPFINGAACHTLHHTLFNYNYGQFTTLWDRLGGSYRKPDDQLFDRHLKMDSREWARQSKGVDAMIKEVEGADDRSYFEKEQAKKVQ